MQRHFEGMDQEARQEKKAALIIPLSYHSATVITAKCLSSSSSSQHPKTLFQCSDNYCYGNWVVSYGEEAHREEEAGKRKAFTYIAF